jgi:hypothetical protein
MTANTVDRSKGHQRIDHKFNFDLFDYDAPEIAKRTEEFIRRVTEA